MPSLHDFSMLSIVVLCLCSLSLLSCAERPEESVQPRTAIAEGDTSEDEYTALGDSARVLGRKDRVVIIACHSKMQTPGWTVTPVTTDAFKGHRVAFLLVGAPEATVDMTAASDFIAEPLRQPVTLFSGQVSAATFFKVKSGGPAAPSQPQRYTVTVPNCGEQIERDLQALTSPGMIVKE